MRGILAEKLFCRDRSYSTFDMQKKKNCNEMLRVTMQHNSRQYFSMTSNACSFVTIHAY